MKRNFYIISLALLLAACGPKVAPTIDPVQIQASAAAMANTMIAETQAAIPPTSALTNTPVPSPTLVATSTETASPTAIGSPTATADPCNGPLFANPVGAADAGKTNNGSNILITNTTKAPITVSMYLSKNELGQCGFVSYALSPMQSVTVLNQLPFGCYYASAYVNDPKKPSRPTGDSVCITGPDRTTVTVSADRIIITGP